MEKIYISGKITGTNDYMERFARAEKELTSKGYIVINPAKVNAQLPLQTSYDEYMKVSFCLLDMCMGIYMMKDWKESKGANMEYKRAKEEGKIIFYET